MKNSNMINEVKRPAFEFPMINLNPNQITKAIISEKIIGSIIFPTESSCMLF